MVLFLAVKKKHIEKIKDKYLPRIDIVFFFVQRCMYENKIRKKLNFQKKQKQYQNTKHREKSASPTA